MFVYSEILYEKVQHGCGNALCNPARQFSVGSNITTACLVFWPLIDLSSYIVVSTQLLLVMLISTVRKTVISKFPQKTWAAPSHVGTQTRECEMSNDPDL